MSTQQHSTQVEHTKSEQSKHISNSDKNTTENISDQQPHESHEQSTNWKFEGQPSPKQSFQVLNESSYVYVA